MSILQRGGDDIAHESGILARNPTLARIWKWLILDLITDEDTYDDIMRKYALVGMCFGATITLGYAPWLWKLALEQSPDKYTGMTNTAMTFSAFVAGMYGSYFYLRCTKKLSRFWMSVLYNTANAAIGLCAGGSLDFPCISCLLTTAAASVAGNGPIVPTLLVGYAGVIFTSLCRGWPEKYMIFSPAAKFDPAGVFWMNMFATTGFFVTANIAINGYHAEQRAIQNAKRRAAAVAAAKKH